MKTADIVQKTDKELVTVLAEQQVKLAALRVDYRVKQVSNIKELAAVRKTVARIKTIMRERAITAAEVGEKETK